MKKGIDVSYCQGSMNWDAVVKQGISFAFIKASQGKLISDETVGPFTDPKFSEHMIRASKTGIDIGVYHYLCAKNEGQAEREADYFVRRITPWKKNINLWAVCDCEEDKYLPTTREGMTSVVKTFCDYVKGAGFKPMLYSNPNYLKYKLYPEKLNLPLWLAYWGVKEELAKKYNPVVWQYGTEYVAGKRCDANIGYYEDEKDTPIKAGDRVKVIRNVIYGTTKKFKVYFQAYDVLSVSGDRAVIGQGKVITAAVNVGDIEKCDT